jgi:hypothetical protein
VEKFNFLVPYFSSFKKFAKFLQVLLHGGMAAAGDFYIPYRRYRQNIFDIFTFKSENRVLQNVKSIYKVKKGYKSENQFFYVGSYKKKLDQKVPRVTQKRIFNRIFIYSPLS